MKGMRAGKWLALVMLAVLVAGLVAGCGSKDTLTALKDRFGGEGDKLAPTDISIETPKVTADGVEAMATVKLYFADPTGQSLVVENREIPKVEGIARATVEELIAGPSPNSKLLPTLPLGTKLMDINIRPDGLAVVDFSRELVNNHVGGSTTETLTVFSVVNTLTQFPTVNRVEFRVDGQNIDSLAGHVDVSRPVTPDLALVSKLQ